MNREWLRRAEIVLVVLAGIGLLAGTRYMDKKEQKQVEESVQNLQDQDKVDMKKADLESQDQAWQRNLEKKKMGNKNVVIVSDNINQGVYQTVYPRMKELGWKGVLVLNDGTVPEKQTEDVTKEQFDEMTENGWDYAFSVSDTIDENGDMSGWFASLDQAMDKWKSAGIDNPGIAVCQVGQYSEANQKKLKQELQAREFHALIVICENEISMEEEFEESWNEMQSVLLRQDYSNVTTMMKSAVGEGKSMSIALCKVTEQPQDTSRELTPAKFEQLVSQIQDMEDSGYQVLSYTEYEKDRKATNEELVQMQSKYEVFLKDKEEKLKELEE